MQATNITVVETKSTLVPKFIGSLFRSLNNVAETIEIATEGIKDVTQASADLSRMALKIQQDRLVSELTVRASLT